MTFSNKIFKPENLIEAVGGCYMVMRRYINRFLEVNNVRLTMEQLVILFMLEENEGMNISQLAYMSDRDKTTTTRMVDGLQKRNLVVKIPDKNDNRQKLVYQTNLARELIQKLKYTYKPKIVSIAHKGIDENEKKQVIDTLVKMVENLQKEE